LNTVKYGVFNFIKTFKLLTFTRWTWIKRDSTWQSNDTHKFCQLQWKERTASKPRGPQPRLLGNMPSIRSWIKCFQHSKSIRLWII